MGSNTAFCRIFYLLFQYINRIDSRIIIFLILCLSKLSFVPTSNEEAYFALAKQYMDPSWIPGSFSFTEWVGTRYLFQLIAGFALRYLSFEQLAFWGRLISYFILSFPLALIFKELKIKNLGILFILQIYIIRANSQHFFGQEWIFGDFEGKTLAYIFVFYSYYCLLKARYLKAALFTALASYFHVLVGGWFFVLVFFYTLLQKFNLRLLVQISLIYLFTVLPFVLYLGSYLSDSGSIINGVDIDQIYSFFRNTHHTAPMHTPDAMQYVFPRVVISFVLLLLSLFYFRKSGNPDIRKLNCIAIIALCMIFIALAITYIDHQGRLLKYYLFRIAAIGAFSYYLLLLLFLKEQLDKRFNPVCIRSLGILAVGIFFLIRSGSGVYHLIYPRQKPHLEELITYVQKHSDPDDVYLFADKEEVSFSRKARREVWVIFKFDPGGGEKIYEWYKREQLRRQLTENPAMVDSITRNYRLDYLISTKPLVYKNLREVHRNPKYYLYAITTSK